MRISFGGKTDVNKMSDDEKTALLKALQANLQEKGCWTAEWLSASGVPCPPVREEELARLKEAKEELAETVRASETKKEELAALRIELDEMTKRRGAILVAVREEEQKLADLHKGDNTIPVQGMEDLKKEIREGMNLVLEKLSAKIDQENRDLVHVLDKVEDKLMRKEADLQGFQEDSRLKATAPFLKQFIHLGDMMRKVVDENPAGAEASAAYLLKQFKQLTDSIDFILRDFSVDVFRRNEGDMRFDPHTQQAFDYPTDNPALDKKVRRTINPGYVWTLPYVLKAKANGEEHPLKEYRMIFRREQVECFKYIK
ncbi:hypothetical protein, partial [Paraprevotella clara]